MKPNYSDIRRRIPSALIIWYDELGVPRYDGFEPHMVANIYADECALILIACQSCNKLFRVAVSHNYIDERYGELFKLDPTTPKDAARMHYGDPPNVNCCLAGPTMNSLRYKVLQFWRRKHGIWVRIPENEVVMVDDPAYKEPT